MTGTPSRAAPAAGNGSARVAARTRPARRDQQPAAGRRRRRPYRHRAEPGPALRHRDSGTRDRGHRRGHRAGCPGRHHRIRAGPGQQHREERPHLLGPGGEPAQPPPHRRCRAAEPAAIVRCPAPAAAASSAAPITAPSSARRDRHHAGSSTCVAPHWRHRDRRGTSPASGPVQDPHRPRPGMPPPAQYPAAPGQASSPPASCRSTNAPSPFTVSTTPPSVNPAALPECFAKKTTGRAAPHPTLLTVTAPAPEGNTGTPAPSARRRRQPKNPPAVRPQHPHRHPRCRYPAPFI